MAQGRFSKIPDSEMVRLYIEEGLGQIAIATRVGLSREAVRDRLKRLGINDSTRGSQRKFSDGELTHMYLELRMGAHRISKVLGFSKTAVTKRLKQLGILDSSRKLPKRNIPKGEPCRPRGSEFSWPTKKQRFSAEGGICQECHQLIGNGLDWRLATYHHIKQVHTGGGPQPENCMVLHPECHRGEFHKLHGYSFPYVNNSIPSKPRMLRVSNEELIRLCNDERLNTKEIAERTSKTYGSILQRISKLRKQGLIIRTRQEVGVKGRKLR